MKVQKAQPVFASGHAQPQIQLKQIKLGSGEKPAWQILAEQNKIPQGFSSKSQLEASKYTQQTENSQVLHSYSENAGSMLITDSVYADIYPEEPPQAQFIQPEVASNKQSTLRANQTKSKLPEVELEEHHEFIPFYKRKRIQKSMEQKEQTENSSFLKLKQQQKELPIQKKSYQNSQGYEELKQRNQQLKQLINQQITNQQQKEQFYNYQDFDNEPDDENADQYRIIRPANFTKQLVRNEESASSQENNETIDPNTQMSKIDLLLQKIDALDKRFNLNLDEPQYQLEEQQVQQLRLARATQQQLNNQTNAPSSTQCAQRCSMAKAYNNYQEAEQIIPVVEFKPDQDEKIKQLQENQLQMQQENKLLQETIKILQQQLQNQELMEQNRMNNQLLMRQIELQEQMLGRNNEQQQLIQQQQMQQLREKYRQEWQEQRQAPPSRTVNYMDQYNAEYNRKLFQHTKNYDNQQNFPYKTTKIIDPYAEEPKQYKVAGVKAKTVSKQNANKEHDPIVNHQTSQNQQGKEKTIQKYEIFRIQPFYDTEIEELDDVSHRLQLQIDGLFD